MDDTGDDDLYTVSKKVNLKPAQKSSSANVEDDFFAFHLEEEVRPKKKLKKRRKIVKSDPQSGSDPVFQVESVDDVEVHVPRRQERVEPVKRQRDVTPPPTSEDIEVKAVPQVDTVELDSGDEFDVELVLSPKLNKDLPLAVKKKKPGLKDQFKLRLDLTKIGLNSTLELLVKGASRVEKVLKVVCDYMKMNADFYKDITLVFNKIRLLNASQICSVLIIDDKLEKDETGVYDILMIVMNLLQYELWKQERQQELIKKYNDDDDDEVIVQEDDDGNYKNLNLHDLQKLANKSLKLRSTVEPENVTTDSFKVILKASEKSKFDVLISPNMQISEIHQIAKEKFALSDLKLVFDDEELDLHDFVADTELEEDYIIDIVTV